MLECNDLSRVPGIDVGSNTGVRDDCAGQTLVRASIEANAIIDQTTTKAEAGYRFDGHFAVRCRRGECMYCSVGAEYQG